MTTQLELSAIDGAAPLRGEPVWWMAFTLDMPDDDAGAAFTKRHGYPPRVYVRDGAILKVGPIEEVTE